VKKAVSRRQRGAGLGPKSSRAQVAALRKENRELARANDILQAAASFFGAALDRQSKKSPGL